LHSAIVQGSTGEVRAALGRGADGGAAEFGGLTPLHKAAFRGDVEVCRTLLGRVAPAAVNLRDSSGQTPLHAAALQLHPDVLQLLLRRGAEADAADHEGLTPARAATARCHKHVGDAGRVAMCLEHLTRTYETQCRVSVAASAESSKDAPPGAGDLDMSTMHNGKLIVLAPMLKAAQRGDPEEVRALLRQRADVGETDPAGHTALHLAAVAAQPALISLLLRHAAGVWVTDREGRTPVRCAVNRLHSVHDLLDLRRLALSIDVLLTAQEREMRQLQHQGLALSTPCCPPSLRCGTAP